MVPPPPGIYWNHRVSVKSVSNLWGTITCRQNLDVKELRSQTHGINSQDGTNAISEHRHRLDHDCANAITEARSDVTGDLWKM
jgi:hypothetical protein